MKTILIILIALLIFSCKDEVPSSSNSVVANQIKLSLHDKKGSDLLNPNNKDGFRENNIKHFYMVNGGKKEVYEPHLDSPKRMGISKENDGAYRMTISLNEIEDKNGKSISLIQWSQNKVDTISAKLNKTRNSIIIIDPKFNGIPIPYTQENGYFIRIIK